MTALQNPKVLKGREVPQKKICEAGKKQSDIHDRALGDHSLERMILEAPRGTGMEEGREREQKRGREKKKEGREREKGRKTFECVKLVGIFFFFQFY